MSGGSNPIFDPPLTAEEQRLFDAVLAGQLKAGHSATPATEFAAGCIDARRRFIPAPAPRVDELNASRALRFEETPGVPAKGPALKWNGTPIAGRDGRTIEKGTTDAVVWTIEFLDRLRAGIFGEMLTADVMVGWFANAIEAGRGAGISQGHDDMQARLAEEHAAARTKVENQNAVRREYRAGMGALFDRAKEVLVKPPPLDRSPLSHATEFRGEIASILRDLRFQFEKFWSLRPEVPLPSAEPVGEHSRHAFANRVMSVFRDLRARASAMRNGLRLSLSPDEIDAMAERLFDAMAKTSPRIGNMKGVPVHPAIDKAADVLFKAAAVPPITPAAQRLLDARQELLDAWKRGELGPNE